jgi:hypothetical protein
MRGLGWGLLVNTAHRLTLLGAVAVVGAGGWFPYAHFEMQLMERVQAPSGGSANNTLFFQIHCFLRPISCFR